MTDNEAITIHTLKCGSISFPGSSRVFPVCCYLVEHPQHGRILVDTGLSPESVLLWPGYLKLYMNPEVSVEQTAVYQLGEMGIAPEDIDVLILTTLDADHVSALGEFAGRVKRIVMAEHEYFYSCRTVYRLRQPTALWMKYVDSIERRYFSSTIIGPQGRGIDVFGDESIICVHVPGHTDGQIAIIVSRANNGRTMSYDGIDYGFPYAVLASDCLFKPMTFDESGRMNAKKWFDEIENDRACVKVLQTHSFSEKLTVF